MGLGACILLIFIASIMYVHYRGRVRFDPLRQALTHTNILAPYNIFIYWCSSVPTRPVLDEKHFPQLKILKDNWQTIRDEALALSEEGDICASTARNDLSFNSFFRTGWKRFYLKWYADFHPSAMKKCPKTVAILKQIPSVNAAMFASLPPGACLAAHRDPYAGSIRYHLGLHTPNNDNCYIDVDGQRLVWQDGAALFFDETYIHTARNDTEDQRIILFCDIHRPLTPRIADRINRFVSDTIIKASATQNIPSESVGVLNKLFSRFYKLKRYSKAFKHWNKPLYKTTKYLSYFGLVYFLFLA